MWKPSPRSIVYRDGQQLRLPLRLVWNREEQRPRGILRLFVTFVLFIVLASIGNQYRPTLVTRTGPLTESLNMVSRQLPNAMGILLTVVIAAVFVDRRRFSDLGLRYRDGWWRSFLGGSALGGAITLTAVIVGLQVGYYEFTGIEITSGTLLWVPVAILAALFQLLFVVPEELLARGYLITNITESFEGVPSIPRGVGAGVGVLAASGFFYVTHAGGKGTVFGLMAGGMSLLLGLGYVLSGDLSIPIGIHFGFNFAGVLVGTNLQPASLMQITSSTTVQQSIALPVEAVIVRLLAAVVSIGLVLWWFHRAVGGLRIAPSIAKPVLRWRNEPHATGSNGTDDS